MCNRSIAIYATGGDRSPNQFSVMRWGGAIHGDSRELGFGKRAKRSERDEEHLNVALRMCSYSQLGAESATTSNSVSPIVTVWLSRSNDSAEPIGSGALF